MLINDPRCSKNLQLDALAVVPLALLKIPGGPFTSPDISIISRRISNSNEFSVFLCSKLN